jgi:hypothetical protein
MKTATLRWPFIWTDVNEDNDNSDSTLYFIHWNRARYSWKAPVKVGVTGDIPALSLEGEYTGGGVGAGVGPYRRVGSRARVALSGLCGMSWK